MTKKEITIPDGASVEINGRQISVTGPKGTASKDFDDPRFNHLVSMEKQDNTVAVSTESERRKDMAMAGTVAAHIRNMIAGVTDGFAYELKIIYTHFPITVAEKDGEIQVRNFLGEKGVRTAGIVGGAKVAIDKETITVSGSDVEHVGQTAANIETACRLRGRDRRVFQDGIFISRKLAGGKEL